MGMDFTYAVKKKTKKGEASNTIEHDRLPNLKYPNLKYPCTHYRCQPPHLPFMHFINCFMKAIVWMHW